MTTAVIDRSRVWLRLAVISIMAGAVLACGGGDSEESTGDGGSGGSERASDSPAVAAGYKEFGSSTKGYSVIYPVDWQVKENAFSSGGISADAFVSDDEINGVTPNINIVREPVPSGTSANDYLKANQTTMKQSGIDIGNPQSVSLGVGQGYLVTYTTSAIGSGKLDFAQVFFVSGKYGWVVTLTTAPGNRDEYMKPFLEIAKSFKGTAQ